MKALLRGTLVLLLGAGTFNTVRADELTQAQTLIEASTAKASAQRGADAAELTIVKSDVIAASVEALHSARAADREASQSWQNNDQNFKAEILARLGEIQSTSGAAGGGVYTPPTVEELMTGAKTTAAVKGLQNLVSQMGSTGYDVVGLKSALKPAEDALSAKEFGRADRVWFSS